jgi:hypothetical protein
MGREWRKVTNSLKVYQTGVKRRDRLEDEGVYGKIILHKTDVKKMRSGRELVSCE